MLDVSRGSYALVLCAAASVLCACKPPAKSSPQPPPVPVEVARAERRAMPVELNAIGTVEPVSSVQVKSKVQGEIVAVEFADGALVRAGDVLFRIDPRPFEAALRRAEANLAIADAAAVNASEQAKRYTTLSRQGAASKEQFSEFISTSRSREAERDARQADVDEARLQLDWTTIHAPIDGRTGAALLKKGNIVQANTDILAVINQVRPIDVAFAVPEGSLPDVRRWLAEGSPSVRVSDPASRRELGTGRLTFVDNAVDRTSGMVNLKATFENQDEALWPGQFVDVVVTLTEEPNVVVVPSTAVMEGQNGSQVFVVEDGVVRLQPVEIERAAGDRTILRAGLQGGETVVTNGQLRLAPGSKVKQ